MRALGLLNRGLTDVGVVTNIHWSGLCDNFVFYNKKFNFK